MVAVEIVERAHHVQLGSNQLQLVFTLADLRGPRHDSGAGARLQNARPAGVRLAPELPAALQQLVVAVGLLLLRGRSRWQHPLHALSHRGPVGRVGLDDADAGVGGEDADADL